MEYLTWFPFGLPPTHPTTFLRIRLQPKFNSLELDSAVGCLVYKSTCIVYQDKDCTSANHGDASHI